MRKLLTIILALSCIPAFAQETASWIRRNEISPDGKSIAFSYKGDIYTVPSDGGKATQITSNDAYDGDPRWTRDGKQIVFTSNREESMDIFVTTRDGGTPKRLTDLPGNETLFAVLPDGRVLFSYTMQGIMSDSYEDFPGEKQLWETDLSGKRPVLVTSLPISAISVNASGAVLYEDFKGYEDPLRKHHTSSVTHDIWQYSPAANEFIGPQGTFKKLSTYEGEDRNPVFATDGDTFYYLSEADGKTSNVWRSSLSSPLTQVQLTFADKNPVRFLSVSNDGLLAYSLNGELYTLREGSEPRKLTVTVFRDEPERDVVKRELSSGATAMALSPDGKEIALIIRGDVFVTTVDYGTTRRITDTPEQERGVSFGEDGRSIFYSSERNGSWGIWKASLTEKNDKLLTYAARIKEEHVTPEGETCFQVEASPDGKKIAYLRDRTELVVMDLKSGKTTSLHKGVNYSYSDGDQEFEWSPDSRFILCNWQAGGGWNNQDIALINIEDGKITDLTESGYSDGSFRWALKGKAMTWKSDKNGYRSHGSWGAQSDIYIMFFDLKAMTEFSRTKEDDEIAKILSGESEKKAEKKEEKERKDSVANKVQKLDLYLDNRDSRIVRLTGSSNAIGDYYLTEDGSKLFFMQRLESGMDLCVTDIKERKTEVLRRGVAGRIVPSRDGKFILVFSGRGISKIPTTGGGGAPAGKGKDSGAITYKGEFGFKAAEERRYIFEHCWKQVKEKFYVEDLHGADWDYYHENYAAFLPHINNNYDFQDLLSEMLGELNGSHTGGRYRPGAKRTMGYLGVIWDATWSGKGMKIKEILPGGAINLADSSVKDGDVILTIEGHEIENLWDGLAQLEDKAGKQIILTLKDKEIILKPSATDSNLLYRRWVRQREEMVAKLSGGRVGYVHIEGMNSPSFRELYSKALGKYRGCDALIVDTRHNGGGWLHDDLVTFLGGKEYCLFTPRGQYIGHEPFNKWTKPSCVLIGEDNYSDAAGFPYAYRSLGLGKLIGAPVPGTMTAVWWETQIDPTLIFGIPQVGNWGTADQCYIENHQIEPDILVYNDPASTLSGRDPQLEAAVTEMLNTIK